MKGFSERNLRFMRQLAEVWPDEEIVKQLVSLLPWVHNIRLMQKVEEPDQRLWYLRRAVEHGWSRDTLAASQVLRRLRDRQLLELHPAGGASYYTVASRADRGELDPQSQELDPAHGVPRALRDEIGRLGQRPGKRQLRQVIQRLCQSASRDTATLAAILHRNPESLARHIRAMVSEGTLRPRFADSPTHPQQTYKTSRQGLLDAKEDN